ncbi:MAG: cytochrome c biogenesis protein CcsA, partial [Bacteroidales bacterium]|nr:cytochrome c biogenesis protein CcsA [Bacteroidales bacterium]
LVVEVTSGENTKEVVLRGGKGYVGEPLTFKMGNANISMLYGSKNIEIPFALQLVKFELERYPGSKSPSSYASEVILIDNKANEKMPYRIYMNHVLNYKGYRFFQSSYDQDEMGTVLSVNHDYWGTFFTYIGYLLMTIGMMLTLFNSNSRFAMLGKVIKGNAVKAGKTGAAVLLMGGLLFSGQIRAQMDHGVMHIPHPTVVDNSEATAFGKLLVQSRDGRLKPINTLSGEILRKVSRSNSFDGQTSDQVFLGMMSKPLEWQQVPIIKIGHPEVSEVLGIDGKYASYLDFIDMGTGTYKLNKYVTEAYEKKPAERSKFDNEIMKVDERLNICFMVYSGDMLKVLPDPGNPDHEWYAPNSKFIGMATEDSLFLSSIIPTFLTSVAEGNTSLANDLLKGISDFQQKYGSKILPNATRTNIELVYNKLLIFDNLSKYYGLLGVFLLILMFVEMFRKSKVLSWIIKAFVVLIVVGFVFQTGGLAMRWYISGHAPWSDGYESLIYIGWVTLLAGLIFSGGSKMTIAATTVLASIILMVAHLSWMDPEVTNLSPVLKSYWLTIHVSIITASYGFLALSALLGMVNLILLILRNKKNQSMIATRVNELTAINERAVMVGLYMLTIGTFLGGVWANESWGRYWGWDPKETWALVSVLIYAFVSHMKYMPGMFSRFSYNFASLISYSSILMTYFGVNYYLSGMHSYAKGDPVPVPTFVYYTVAVIFILSLWAYIREKQLERSGGE